MIKRVSIEKKKPAVISDDYSQKKPIKSGKNSFSSSKPIEVPSDVVSSSSIIVVKRKFANSITSHPLFHQTPGNRADFGCNESDSELIPSEQKEDTSNFLKSDKSSSFFNSALKQKAKGKAHLKLSLKKLQPDELHNKLPEKQATKSKSFINTINSQVVNRDSVGPGSLIASCNRMSMIETRLSSQQESNAKVITPRTTSSAQMSSKIAHVLASKAVAKTMSS